MVQQESRLKVADNPVLKNCFASALWAAPQEDMHRLAM